MLWNLAQRKYWFLVGTILNRNLNAYSLTPICCLRLQLFSARNLLSFGAVDILLVFTMPCYLSWILCFYYIAKKRFLFKRRFDNVLHVESFGFLRVYCPTSKELKTGGPNKRCELCVHSRLFAADRPQQVALSVFYRKDLVVNGYFGSEHWNIILYIYSLD